MNRKKNWLGACASLTTLVLGGLAQAPSETVPTGEAREIQVSARKYEFNPSVITVKKGERVKLVITALDRDHGFKLEAFRIDQKLNKGAATTIEFRAEKVGTFQFKCSTFCGLGHRRMKGRLVVEESPNP